MTNMAICITLGEQSENHVGMEKYGNGLAANGYSYNDLLIFKDKFEKLNCTCELLHMNDPLKFAQRSKKVGVLIIRNAVNTICNIPQLSDRILTELTDKTWDKQYFDTRRQKVLNKRARWNVCIKNDAKPADYENRQGTVLSYNEVPNLGLWKKTMEEIINEPNELECEGNMYYDAKKCGIGFHGDAERKKVVAASFCSKDVVREIRWQWYIDSLRVGQPVVVKLYNGDCYIMSEKATGFDWKRRNIFTLRHAAGVEGNKYLK